MWRRAIALIALSLTAVACASDEEVALVGPAAGGDDLSTFCSTWDELADFVSRSPAPTAETFDTYFALAGDVKSVLPAELTDHWDDFIVFNRTMHDLLVTVEFDVERVDDDLIARAFGDAETAGRQEDASEAAFGELEDWAAAECGDFCARWPELRQTLDELAEPLEWGDASAEELGRDDEDGQQRLARLVRTLDLGTELAPDAVRADWELLVATRTDWIRWWEAAGFDGRRATFEGVEGEQIDPRQAEVGLEIMRTAAYFAPEHIADHLLGSEEEWRSIEAWKTGAPLPDDGWGIEWVEQTALWVLANPPPDRNQPLDERLQDWVSDNCASAGAPGRVVVGFTEPVIDSAGGTLLISLLPRGGTVGDLVDATDLLGSVCVEINENPFAASWKQPDGRVEYWTFPLSSEPGEYSGPVCWQNDPGVFAGGDRTIVAAVFPSGLEGWFGTSDAVAPPTRCVEYDITVAGDTEVLIPPPEPCEVADWPDDVATDPWRNPPPVDPATPGAGTVKVVVPSLLPPEEVPPDDGPPIVIVAVPVGTTINEIGREEVWPLGATCVWLRPQGQTNEEDRRRLDRPIEVPLGPMLPAGPPTCLEPGWIANDPPDDQLPLALLAPGEITVRASIESHADESGPRAWCATVDLVVDGDTVVDLSDWSTWEECRVS